MMAATAHMATAMAQMLTAAAHMATAMAQMTTATAQMAIAAAQMSTATALFQSRVLFRLPLFVSSLFLEPFILHYGPVLVRRKQPHALFVLLNADYALHVGMYDRFQESNST